MPQTSFDIDEKIAEALEALKVVYGVTSNAAVMKRALAIALIASRQADDDDNIHFLCPGADGNPPREVIVPQRF